MKLITALAALTLIAAPAQALTGRDYQAAMRICKQAFNLNTMGIAAGPGSDVWKAVQSGMDPANQRGAVAAWNEAKNVAPACSTIY